MWTKCLVFYDASRNAAKNGGYIFNSFFFCYQVVSLISSGLGFGVQSNKLRRRLTDATSRNVSRCSICFNKHANWTAHATRTHCRPRKRIVCQNDRNDQKFAKAQSDVIDTDKRMSGFLKWELGQKKHMERRNKSDIRTHMHMYMRVVLTLI